MLSVKTTSTRREHHAIPHIRAKRTHSLYHVVVQITDCGFDTQPFTCAEQGNLNITQYFVSVKKLLDACLKEPGYSFTILRDIDSDASSQISILLQQARKREQFRFGRKGTAILRIDYESMSSNYDSSDGNSSTSMAH